MKEFLPLIKKKNFLYLWGSQVFSQITINLMNFIILIELFRRTDSSIATSFLWIAYALPAVIVGPLGAAVVDIVDRRRILILTNFLQALAVFLLALAYREEVFLLYTAAVLYSLLNQFYLPAEAAYLPSLVNQKILPQANSLFFITQQAAIVLGFGAAGLLENAIEFKGTLYLASGLLLAAFLSVRQLPKLKTERIETKALDQMIFDFFEKILNGYRFIREEKRVLIPFLLLLFFQVGLAVIVVSIPAIASHLLTIDVNRAGLYIVVPAATGALIGAFLIPKLIKARWRKKRIIQSAMILLSVSGLGLVVFPKAALLAILLTGLGFVGIIVPSQTFLQEVTPGGMRGRVFGNFWFLVTVATIFPVIFSGAVADLFGIRSLILVIVGLIVASLGFSNRVSKNLSLIKR